MISTSIAIISSKQGFELLGIVVLAICVMALGFLIATDRLWRSSSTRPSLSKPRLIALLAGIGLLVFAWNIPLDLLGMSFHFTTHMTQHLLLSLVIPPLLLTGLPPRWVSWMQRFPAIQQGIGLATFAFFASMLFNANIWIWHAPPLHQAMSASVGLHWLSSLLYLVTGLLFWWPLLNPLHKALPLVGKLIYLFLSDMPMMLLGAGLTFTSPLYRMSMGAAAPAMLVSAVDQQLGGLLMWIGGTLFFIVISSILLLRWLLEQERLEEQRRVQEQSA
jgi:putative membrane protein